jgi:tetratricopeptide (TPR) repeat protein
LPKTAEEIFSEKVSLIYEYDKASPLFVRVANTEIEKNNIDKAVGILQNGIKNYPDYAVAYFILGKAFTLIGNYSQALLTIKKGSELIRSKKSYDYYLKEIENIKKQRSLFESRSRNAFMLNDEELDFENNVDLFEEDKHTDEDKTKRFSFDDRLDQLAKEISSAKIPEASGDSFREELDSSLPEEHMIVSETLAKIYITQGEYKEAIEVYKKLSAKNPQKKEYYAQRIEELRSEFDT